MPSEQHNNTWEHHQAELWDRVFQVTQDVVDLAGNLSDEGGNETVKDEMIKISSNNSETAKALVEVVTILNVHTQMLNRRD